MKSDQNLSSIIHDLSYRPAQRVKIFRSLETDDQVEVLRKLSHHVLSDTLLHLEEKEVVSLLEHLDPDETTDILRLLPKNKREKLICEIHEELKNDISKLLSFEENTAAGLMSLDYILVSEEAHIADVSEKVLTHEQRTGKIPIILVSNNNELRGYIPGHQFGFAKPSDSAKKHIRPIGTLKHNLKKNQVLEFFRNHPHSKAAVLGENGGVIGVIFSDDVIQLLREQESASLYNYAGVSNEESIYDPTWRKVQFRYKWLITNLATAFLAASTVHLFEGTISRQVLLAVYMPIVAGMGGNAGTQTLAVMVRGLAFHELNLQRVLTTLKYEVGAGLTNGLINGVIVFSIVSIINRNFLVAAILGTAMVTNLTVAAFFGTIVPVIMHKLGKDPASSATIFITTATDVCGFSAFLGLATLLLR